ncbi:MAG: thiol-disulfide oxidoreductase DCC family protein [Actinomadura sp.]
MARRKRPVLVYDGDCAFCTSSVRFIERHIPTSAEITAFQFADLDALGTTDERAEREVLWVDCDGLVRGGAPAVAALLVDAGGVWRPLGAIMRIPPVSRLARGVYRLVADNRDRMPGGTPACALPADQRPGAPPGT